MIAEILSVGTELLLGQTVDTNAVYIAKKLALLGITVHFRTTVGDNSERMHTAIRAALKRADLVITIGGLGPTMDDLTKQAVAEVTGIALQRDQPHAEWLRERFQRRSEGAMPELFLQQADIPVSGQGIVNPQGTALGSIFVTDSHTIICLPGPPIELIPMVEHTVEPYLLERTSGERTIIKSRTLRITGLGESLVEERIADLMLSENPSVAPYAKTGEVHLRITARAGSEAEANRLIDPAEAQIREQLNDFIYGVDDETLESAVVKLLVSKNLKLSLAESCTGGLISKRITDVPGASSVFELGLITYSNTSKIQYLNVEESQIAEHGAVSAEVARAMAMGALSAGKSQVALSVTGTAGPTGGTYEKPVGTVFIGLAWHSGCVSEKHHFLGRRNDISLRASQSALTLLRRFLLDPNSPEFTPGQWPQD